MNLNLSADEVLTTTRSVRKRLDLDKPVPREVLMECLEIALQAPTGSNAQGWQWMFITDPVRKQAIADIYRANALPYLDRMRPDYGQGDVRSERMDLVSGSAKYLAEVLQEVPVLMIPCLEGKPETGSLGFSASFWASLFPAAWSFCLALFLWWWLSRSVKLLPHLRRRPAHFFLMPAYTLMSFLMAVIKIWALLTIRTQKWLTRPVQVTDSGEVVRTNEESEQDRAAAKAHAGGTQKAAGAA